MKFKAGLVSFAATMLIFIALSAPARGQTGPPPQTGPGNGLMQRDPVAMLNKALESAGAAQLSDAQQQQLTILVDNYRATHQNGGPDQTIQSASKSLEAAILAGNEDAANSAADTIANELTARTGTIIRDLAKFEIQVLSVLIPDQVKALKTQFGNSGLVHTLGFLAGGFGPGMVNGFGFGMNGGMRPGMGGGAQQGR